MPQLPKTQLLPDFDFVLLHASFLNKVSYLCREYRQKINIGEKMISEIKAFVQEIQKVQTLVELKYCIDGRLKVTQNQPKGYYQNGYRSADHLFYFLPVSIVEGDLGAICLFFPALFVKNNFDKALSCCSLSKNYLDINDVRCVEIYDATYRPPFSYSC